MSARKKKNSAHKSGPIQASTNGQSQNLLLGLINLADEIGGRWGKKSLAKHAVEVCKRIMDADACSIFLVESGKNTLSMFCHTGYNLQVPPNRIRYPLIRKNNHKLGVTGWIATECKPFTTNRRSEFENCEEYDNGKYDEKLWGKKHKDKCQSFFGIPLVVSDRVIGVMKVESSKEKQFASDKKKALFKIGASMVALSMRTALVLEQIHALYAQLAQEFDTISHPYSLLAETCCNLVDAESCSIFILNRAKRLVLRGDAGYKVSFVDNVSEEYTYGPGEGQTYKVIQNDEPHRARNAEEVKACPERRNKLYEAQWDGPHECHSWYQFPVGTGEKKTPDREVLGLMKVENKLGSDRKPREQGGFSEQDEAILEIIANTAVPLIEKAKTQTEIAEILDAQGFAAKLPFTTKIDEIFEPDLLNSIQELD